MTLEDTVIFTLKPRQVASRQRAPGPSFSMTAVLIALMWNGPWAFLTGAKLLL